jgi:hypothetical protein
MTDPCPAPALRSIARFAQIFLLPEIANRLRDPFSFRSDHFPSRVVGSNRG